MSTFVCADLHFNHANIIKYEDRPFADRDEMNEKLIEFWNEVVGHGDCVYVLGDVGFAGNSKISEWINRLNGYKILVMGNHDRTRSAAKWGLMGFDNVYKGPISVRYNHQELTWTKNVPYLVDPQARYMVDKLAKQDLVIMDKVSSCWDRGEGIVAWLLEHPDVKDWIAIDDDMFPDFKANGIIPHLVRTNFYKGGLLERHVKKAVKLLNE